MACARTAFLPRFRAGSAFLFACFTIIHPLMQAYCLFMLVYGVATFNDCSGAADALKAVWIWWFYALLNASSTQEIQEARADLRAKGFKFTE